MAVRALLVIDALAALIVLYFFLEGLGDGTVSADNGGLWFAILAGIAAVTGGGFLLNANGHRLLAILVLLVLAIPALLYGLFIALVLILQPRWN